MNKINFFGRCIGATLKVPDEKENGILTAVNLQGIVWLNNDCDYPISDCSIIGRRISQMSYEEKSECRKLMLLGQFDKYDAIPKGYFDHNQYRYYHTYESIDYLYSINVFPDSYFDKQTDGTIWAVEP